MIQIEARLHDKNGFLNALEIGDFEYVDPVIKMGEIYLSTQAWMNFNRRKIDKKYAELYSEDEVVFMGKEEGFERFKKHYVEAMSIQVPETLTKLFAVNKKKRQNEEIAKLASTTVLTSNSLMGFIYRAHQEYGYTYSMYTGEKLPNGVFYEDMPPVALAEDDGGVSVWGETSLKNGKIGSVIKDRSNTIGKFLDKGDEWHCFFYTMAGLSGRERGQGPHMHYISSAWGMSRDRVVNDIRSGEYHFYSDNHIPYKRYT